MRKKDFLVLAGFLLGTQAAGIIGSFFTSSSIPTWYAFLTKPELAPPNFVFAPVWTTLFVLMAIGAFIVWRKGFARKDVWVALSVYVVQLVLNTLWSIIFFGMQNPKMAFFEIIVLWAAIVTTIVLFARISKIAGLLLIPYIAWVSFAAYLNYGLWMLN